ncbi:HNH endonuclease [Rubrivivax rivuli]|uniref:HNH endonuclease n=1 Tax=Rubrivivax rivuli TaxID=1862385 RepID=A0A437RLL5_9BURK|nr:HNH endonuclease signature motif containing protein [Rubrivivax rivuli]RVU47659.1 HNH endonuclease [Rubrivivax rivuli]
MASYTFFFNKQTFDGRRSSLSTGDDWIDYLTGDDRRPLNTMSDGDEVFVVGLLDGKVRLGGRLIVDGKPVRRAEAELKLGRRDIRDGDIYLIGKRDRLDRFRPNHFLDASVARVLELYTSSGDPANVDGLRNGSPDPNQFRTPLRLSEESAAQLRRALELDTTASHPAESETSARSEADDDLEGDEDERQQRAIKTRRGQARFREALMLAYKRRCAISRCAVEELLEAAHIRPHSEQTDYAVSNGLLLRSDLHTLFDLKLLAIDDRYRVRLSEKLRNSEYWKYQGQDIAMPDRVSDNPDRDALARRLLELRGA